MLILLCTVIEGTMEMRLGHNENRFGNHHELFALKVTEGMPQKEIVQIGWGGKVILETNEYKARIII